MLQALTHWPPAFAACALTVAVANTSTSNMEIGVRVFISFSKILTWQERQIVEVLPMAGSFRAEMAIEEPSHDVEGIFGFGHVRVIEEAMEETVPHVKF